MNKFGTRDAHTKPSLSLQPDPAANESQPYADLCNCLRARYDHRRDGIPTQPVNPDGDEAAGVIERLVAEIRQLKTMPKVDLHTLLGFEAGLAENAAKLAQAEAREKELWKFAVDVADYWHYPGGLDAIIARARKLASPARPTDL